MYRYSVRIICRHCSRAKVVRPRGLCWTCFHKPGVRDLFPITSKYARRGVGHYRGPGEPPLPPATTALPGTPEKIAVLAERARANQVLFHPADAARTND